MQVKRYRVLVVFISLLLGGCCLPKAETEKKEQATIQKNETDENYEEWVKDPEEKILKTQQIPIDPPYEFDIELMKPADFGEYFINEYESQTELYFIAENTEWENNVVHISGEEPGNVVYIVAGVHGDEEAAWQTGELLKKISIKAGELYILSPANRWGAEKNPKSRYVISHEDLNRSFPGDKEGNVAERIAYTIYNDIEQAAPDLVLDLHEAKPVSGQYDFIGNSLIFTDMNDQMELLMDMVSETESGALCNTAFNLYGPGPEGSVNAEISKNLKIPVITIETYRGYTMETRLTDQMDLIQYVLKRFQMIEE